MIIKNFIQVTSDVREPTVGNNGYSLDVYAPQDIYLKPGAYLDVPAGFILNLPEPYIGLLAPKTHLTDKFEVTSGQVIHPGYSKEIKITLKYSKLSESFIKKGEPLFQIVVVHGVNLNA